MQKRCRRTSAEILKKAIDSEQTGGKLVLEGTVVATDNDLDLIEYAKYLHLASDTPANAVTQLLRFMSHNDIGLAILNLPNLGCHIGDTSPNPRFGWYLPKSTPALKTCTITISIDTEITSNHILFQKNWRIYDVDHPDHQDEMILWHRCHPNSQPDVPVQMGFYKERRFGAILANPELVLVPGALLQG